MNKKKSKSFLCVPLVVSYHVFTRKLAKKKNNRFVVTDGCTIQLNKRKNPSIPIKTASTGVSVICNFFDLQKKKKNNNSIITNAVIAVIITRPIMCVCVFGKNKKK